MKKILLSFTTLCLLLFSSLAQAQTATININSPRQTIRGFGGMNFPRWIADLTPEQVDRAFGNGPGQIGLNILRVSVSPNRSQWGVEVPTAQRAKDLGAIVLGTPWSPPASMKTNGSTVRGELRTDAYGDYAQYLTDFTNYMAANDASLYAISVQNEPDWLPDYESCGWSPVQMYNFVRYYAGSIPTRVLAAEALGFNKSYTNLILDDPAAATNLDIVGGHLYGTPPSDYPQARNLGKEIWMTEHYTTSDRSANLWPDALEVGKEVNDCMINNFNAYIWWYIRRSYGLLTEDGNVSKRGFVMSHFSKFVRPGFNRVEATVSPTPGVNVSAYVNGSTVVVVVINQNASPQNITLNFSGTNVSNITKWETTGTTRNNVAQVGTYAGGTSLANTLTGYSIATFRGTIGSGGDGGGGTPSAFYRLQNRATGLYLDGLGRTVNAEAGGQYANTNSANAQWERIEANGYSRFRNRATGLFLDGLGRTTNGADVGQYANTNSVNAQWELVAAGGNYYRLRNRGTGLFLDGMDRTTNGAACGQYANTNSTNAQWQLVPVSSSARTAEVALKSTLEADQLAEGLALYPNPVRETLHIQLGQEERLATARLFNLSGQLMMSNRLITTDSQLSVGHLQPGVYFVEVTTTTGSQRMKFIKQ